MGCNLDEARQHPQAVMAGSRTSALECPPRLRSGGTLIVVFNIMMYLFCFVRANETAMPSHLPKYAGLAVAPENQPSNSVNKSFGLLDIPEQPIMPVSSCIGAIKCELEYFGDFERAFAHYEKLALSCSDYGWVTVAHLGRGETAEVVLRQTPCGSLVAMKVPTLDPDIPPLKRLDAQRNIAADCAVLKRLVPFLDDPSCDGCFPQYYYYSNTSGICYNEYKKSIPLSAFFRALKPRAGGGGFSNAMLQLSSMKTLFTQGLSALEILKQNHIVHRDLLAKNMLVRLQPRSDPQFRLVIMDFCWATSEYDAGVTRGFTTLPLGHFTRTPDWCVSCCFPTLCVVPPEMCCTVCWAWCRREHGWEDTYASCAKHATNNIVPFVWRTKPRHAGTRHPWNTYGGA